MGEGPVDEIRLDADERRIASFVRGACAAMPGRPVARVAGGWVRDKLLGGSPKDIDLAVDCMPGDEFAEGLRRHAVRLWGPRQSAVGEVKGTEGRPEQIKNLAVAFLRVHGREVEVLRLRREEYAAGDRNPVAVGPATAEEDALRRDLTINSLFYNLTTRRVEDWTGRGRADLASMTLRTPLDPLRTFAEDPLRLLRVLRFYSRYPGSAIAPDALDAMRDPGVQLQITRRVADPSAAVGIVVERTADELRRIMLGARPGDAVRVMHEVGLLAGLLNLPAGWRPLGMDQNNPHHSLSVVEHAAEAVGHANRLAAEFGLPDGERAALNLAALVHDLGKLDPRTHWARPDGATGYSGDPADPGARTHEDASAEAWGRLARSLRLGDAETALVGGIVAGHMLPHAHAEGGGASDKALRRYLRKNPGWRLQYIHAMADAMAKARPAPPGADGPHRRIFARLCALAGGADGPLRAADPLDGREIMRIVGLPPEPPRGMVGYVEVAKERIRERRDERPGLTAEEAADVVRGMAAAGEFDAYAAPPRA